MGIAERFVNIVNSYKNVSSSNDYSSSYDELVERLLDNDDDELIKEIDEAFINSQYYVNEIEVPDDIESAFRIIGVNREMEFEQITKIFKEKLKQFHPDKNPNISDTEKQILSNKTAELIENYILITKYFKE